MTTSLLIVYASTSGHTEFVVDTLIHELSKSMPTLRVIKQRAEVTKPEDFTKASVLLLAASTWNTGNTEGQLNPHMYDLLNVRAAGTKLSQKPCTVIGLGDERYYYTARAAEKMAEFIAEHGGTLLLPPLKIINEPFGQEDKVASWSKEFVKSLSSVKE